MDKKDNTPKVHRRKRSRSKRSKSQQDGAGIDTSTDKLEETSSHPAVLINGYEQDEEDDLDEVEKRSSVSLSPRHQGDSISVGGGDVKDRTPRRPSTNSTSRLEVKSTYRNQSNRGLTGFMDRELGLSKKISSLSDPQASPAQRSMRSRSSLDKSPRRKRSKSESKRRRERKLIAAGEMEVKQANETLMRYLKQCSEMNDASLSGELEIDQNYDERKVHRKTKAERNKKGQLIRKLYTHGALSSILKDLSDDILPADGDEIYNPFTPVVSPTDDQPTRINKMFVQTSTGYRPVDHCFYKNSIGGDIESNRIDLNKSANMSSIQRIWLIFSTLCHGLLGGLAFAHLLFIMSTKPSDWSQNFVEHYSSFATTYSISFYVLSVICILSVFFRMNICHIDLSNAGETISFKWIIITMMYVATIILTACSEFLDEKSNFTFVNNSLSLNSTDIPNQTGFETKHFIGVWNSISTARSICAISGWILIAFAQGDFLQYNNFVDMERYPLTN